MNFLGDLRQHIEVNGMSLWEKLGIDLRKYNLLGAFVLINSMSFAAIAEEQIQRVEITDQRPGIPGAFQYGSLPFFVNHQFINTVNVVGRRLPKKGVAKVASNANSSVDPCSDAESGQNPIASNPVILATGEKYQPATDIIANGDYALGLDRTYKSFSTSSTMFGAHWFSSYDFPALQTSGCSTSAQHPGECIPRTVVMTYSDGAQYTYSATDHFGEYTVKGAVSPGTMTFVPGKYYQVKDGNGTYIYSTTSFTIQSASFSNGGSMRFMYASPSDMFPSQVNNVAGHYVNFTYGGNGRVSVVTDQDGNQWRYSYSGQNLTEVTSPGNSPDVITYHYESPYGGDLLTGISINGTRYSTYEYDANKRVTSSRSASGEINDRFSYTTNSTSMTDAVGQTTVYNFVPAQGALKVSSISRNGTNSCPFASARTNYDNSGWVSSTVDWNGITTNYWFDETGRLFRKTKAAGTNVELTERNSWVGENLGSTTYTDTNGVDYLQVIYAYISNDISSGPAKNKISRVVWKDLISGNQAQTNYAYTFQANNVLSTMAVSEVLPSGPATITYTYDSAGNLASVTNPLGQRIQLSDYNGRGMPGRITDVNGTEMAMVWDEKSNLTSSTLNLPSGPITTSYVYNHAHQPLSIAYPDGHVTRYQYNASLRAEYVGNALGEFIHSAFDAGTNTWTTSSDRKVPSVSASMPVGNIAEKFVDTLQMDTLGRVLVHQGNNGQSIKYTYDANGNIKTVTDTQKHVTSLDYDALNRVVKKTLPDGGIIIYDYDARGNLKSITDPRGLVTSYTYDAFGRVLTLTSPDTKLTTYTYDNFGRLLSEGKANGNTVVYTWDALGRKRSRAHGNIVQYFNYDEGLYGIGRLTSLTDSTGETRYSYNAIGQLVKQTNVVLGRVFNTSWEYDAVGQLRSMSYPTGLVLHYDYDQYGRLSNVRSINSIDK